MRPDEQLVVQGPEDLVEQASQVAEKPGFGVILSEAKNLSSI
jgi:hypothetical protein